MSSLTQKPGIKDRIRPRLNGRPDVRFGSKADICAAKRHVRFTPESRHLECNSSCRFGPKADIEPLLDKSWIATAQRFDEKQAS